MSKTKIEWATDVWNPVTGCSPISAGCDNCYAETMAHRLQVMGVKGYENGFEVTVHPGRLDEPLKWKKPRRIFVVSMGDLFHKKVPYTFFTKVMVIITHCPQHTFLLLTKRPERMAKCFENIGAPENVWLGVSVENQEQADKRISILLQIPAKKRFVSVEPMLGVVNLLQAHQIYWQTTSARPLINWVIVGCESGPNRRHFDEQWARDLKDQCIYAGIPFFLKQSIQNGKLVKMPVLDGKVWNEIP